MALSVRIVVVDAAPLITLAVAKSLDYLLYAKVPIIIPDAVFYEATAISDRLGAQEIIDWWRHHQERVRIEPTDLFANAIAQMQVGLRPVLRDMGERAALAVIRGASWLGDQTDRALLLSDDRDVERLIATDPERIILLTTWDYLRQLEAERLIQSAELVFLAVKAAGRSPAKRDLWSGHDPQIRDAVRAILSKPAAA